MARVVNHKKNIFPLEKKKGNKYLPSDIIQFYNITDGTRKGDRRPVVLILEKNLELVKGINLNYLTEYKVSLLLSENNIKNLKNYEFYEKAFRTYSIKKIKRPRFIEFKTNDMLREENRLKVMVEDKKSKVKDVSKKNVEKTLKKNIKGLKKK